MIENFFLKIFRLSKFKIFEIQFYLCDMYFNGLSYTVQAFTETRYFHLCLNLYLLKLNLDFTRRCDHRGIEFTVSLFNINFDFRLYDIRHWEG
jgi:hypothetical protein